MQQLTGGSKSGLAELKGAVEELQHDLMRHEMQLVEQLDVRKLAVHMLFGQKLILPKRIPSE